ncbi:MAG: ABC transporter ATP-binding protein [Deltaproteobacteria bacterium]|nr:ABC transporter ATP-binding protein [Deltaproteobacteria bacterium]
MPPLLEINNLQTYFFTRDGVVKAVDGVSFYLEPGETLGIVGESGSGKTVLNLSYLRLIPQPPGRIVGGGVRFAGLDLLAMPDPALRAVRGDKVGMIFQDPMTSLNPFLTIERQLTEVLEIHRGETRVAARRQAIAMLDLVGIPDADRRARDYPHQFSGGMRQRAMIAMALLCRPALLIADEPTTALDVTIQAQILELLKNLQREFRMAMILITHNLGVVAGTCDRIAVMYAGRIVEEGSAERIFGGPMHPYTRALLRAVPRLDSDRRDHLAAIPDQPPDLSHLPTGCHFHPRCPLAETVCRAKDPPLMECGVEHGAACWVTTKERHGTSVGSA